VTRLLERIGARAQAVWFALAVGGVAFTAIQLYVGNQIGIFPIPGGDTYLWDRVGDQIRSGAGGEIYAVMANRDTTFWYAPPWAIFWAAISWIPIEALYGLLFVAKVLSLRVIGGSWIGAGIACWFPLVAFDLASGNINLVIAASIVAAVRARPRLAVAMALAKLSPALAIHPDQWRIALQTAVVCAAITILWLPLWPAWISHLIAGFGQPFGPQIGIPFLVRAAAALVLLAIGRRWSRSLAAAVAIPALYYASLVILIAPVAVVVRDFVEHRSLGDDRPFPLREASEGRSDATGTAATSRHADH
jgi:hypothetical protein